MAGRDDAAGSSSAESRVNPGRQATPSDSHGQAEFDSASCREQDGIGPILDGHRAFLSLRLVTIRTRLGDSTMRPIISRLAVLVVFLSFSLNTSAVAQDRMPPIPA